MLNIPMFNNGINSPRLLLGYWKLQGDFKDYSGNGFDLVQTGTVPFAVIANKKCSGPYSGVNYFQLPAAALTALTAEGQMYAVEVEVYCNPGAALSQEILDIRGAASAVTICDIRPNSQSVYLNPPNSAFQHSATFATNTWNSCVWNSMGVGSTTTMYYNNLPFNIPVFPDNGAGVTVARVGAEATVGTFPMLGYIRNLKIWKILPETTNFPTNVSA